MPHRRRWSRVPWLVLALALLGLKPAEPLPGEVGYQLPWNRDNPDSVVDLAPGERWPRLELKGRLLDNDHHPVAGRLYVYYADLQYGYGGPVTNDVPLRAGTLTIGPGGGFRVLATLPSIYAGPPHLHFELMHEGRSVRATFVSLLPDSSAWPLPGGQSPGIASSVSSYDLLRTVVHLGQDGVYRTTHDFALWNWNPLPSQDTLRSTLAARYERHPWRGALRARGVR